MADISAALQSPWVPDKFMIALPWGPEIRKGFTYNGIGVHLVLKGSPKGRRKPRWHISHLGTGHAIAYVEVAAEKLQQIVTEIAEAGDWTFDGLDGWKNQFPDAPDKLREISGRYPVRRLGGAGNLEHVAQSIAAARNV